MRPCVRRAWRGEKSRPSDAGLPFAEVTRAAVEPSLSLLVFAIGGYCSAVTRRNLMHGLIYLIGLIVVIMAILSFFGLR